MAALPLKLRQKRNLEEKANATGDQPEVEPALEEDCVLKAETGEAIVDESARQSLIDEGKKDTEQVLLISDTPNKKSLFKNDCGLLRLLPSKRKFAWEDHKQLDDESDIKDGRRSTLEHELNPNGKAVNVGSFMKWMIDVGKGLAKRRRFPAPLASFPHRSTNPSFLDSSVSNDLMLVSAVQNQDLQRVQVQANENTTMLLPVPAAKENGSYDCHETQVIKCSAVSNLERKEAEDETTEQEVDAAKPESLMLQNEDYAGKEVMRQDSSPEFIASMATVKSWVCRNFRCRENRKPGSISSLNCRYCGLQGHNVWECSETLDCEVKELERRDALLEEMSSEVEEFPCLRCLGTGHLGAHCRFSVTEAASRARENSEFKMWELTCRRDKAPSSSRLLQRHKDTTRHRLKPQNESKTKQPEGSLDCRKGKRSQAKPGLRSDAPPVVPKGFFAAVESVRLSRSELWSLEISSQARGFFLRLRFGRWEKAMGGTGYRMARIRGSIRKAGDDKSMSVCVDLGDIVCTVDSQYVSNHCFTEAELVEWWKGRWRSGKRLISQAELQTKLAQLQTFIRV